MRIQELPAELRSLVREVFDIWGEVIKDEAGPAVFKSIESLREFLKFFRNKSSLSKEVLWMKKLEEKMAKLPRSQIDDVTHAFAMLLELINLCENSVRSHKIRQQQRVSLPEANLKQEIYLVLTAHPTESRAPEMVALLQEVQKTLSDGLFDTKSALSEKLKPQLKKLWYLRMAREQKPQVKDEAEYIYSVVFRPEILKVLLKNSNGQVYLRTWVGGDKDGHPGVNEEVMLQSLQLSRSYILKFLEAYASLLEKDLLALRNLARNIKPQDTTAALKNLGDFRKCLKTLTVIRSQDAKRVQELNKNFSKFESSLKHPGLKNLPYTNHLKALLRIFPNLVVPLELRESSDVFRTNQENPEPTAIFKMLTTLKDLAGNSDPRGYARGLIISMTETEQDLAIAESFLKKALGSNYYLPLIPLFEKDADLKNGPKITENWIRSRKLKKFEVMLGYSDSSKESGVLASRIAIREALNKLNALSERIPDLTITFFHGSGGSVDRGGGNLESQTAHWPQAAFDRFKVTIQGEMVQRTFSTPEILDHYLEKIRQLSLEKKTTKGMRTSPTLEKFAELIAEYYKHSISDSSFLEVVEQASAYRFLEELRFGSRPTKRKKLTGVDSLRAIPWILSWTQTRVLLPTWWGVGSAYNQMTDTEKRELERLAQGKDPMFSSFLQLLGFTLAKIEPAVWFLYLEQSDLSQDKKKNVFKSFLRELEATTKAFHALTGEKNYLWFRPWLQESIRLRAPMIHPLNVAQLTAWQQGDNSLLREASVGIACGMLTTG